MPKLLKEWFIKKAIISWLSRNGWGTNLRSGELSERGVDIKVMHNKYPRYFLVEAKGEGKSKHVNENNFVYGLGQIITRMNTSRSTRYRYGLGLPEKSAGVAKRRVPWQIAKKLLLSIFSVDKNGKVKCYEWKEIKQFQRMKKMEV